VMVHGRNLERIQATLRLMGHHSAMVGSVQGDISKPEDCETMVRNCIREHGRLDILINNAGTGSNGLFMDTVPEAARSVIETNLLGSFFPTYFALPHIKASEGSVVFISSLAAFHGLPYCSPYSASKMALTALSQSLRIELSGSGVHTGIIYVGFLKNDPEKRIIGCDGQLVPATTKPPAFSMSLERASRQIIRAIQQRSSMKVISNLGKLLYQVNRISPYAVRKVLKNSMISMTHAYTPQMI